MLISFVVTGVKAQDNQEIVDYYDLKIDELVEKWQNVSSDYEEEKTNPVYARVFTTPVLYNSVIEKAFRQALLQGRPFTSCERASAFPGLE